MIANILITVVIAAVGALEDKGEKGFFALHSPAFQPMARQWMPSLGRNAFEDDEMRFHNFAGVGGGKDHFFGGFDDSRDDLRFGFDDDRLRNVASFRTSFRAPVLPQGQPVVRRVSAPFRGYYGEDNDDMMENFYSRGFYGQSMFGAGFGRPLGPMGGTMGLQMNGLTGPHMTGAFGGHNMGMMRPGLMNPFMMNPFMMRGAMMGRRMMGPMIGAPLNPLAMGKSSQTIIWVVYNIYENRLMPLIQLSLCISILLMQTQTFSPIYDLFYGFCYSTTLAHEAHDAEALVQQDKDDAGPGYDKSNDEGNDESNDRSNDAFHAPNDATNNATNDVNDGKVTSDGNEEEVLKTIRFVVFMLVLLAVNTGCDIL